MEQVFITDVGGTGPEQNDQVHNGELKFIS